MRPAQAISSMPPPSAYAISYPSRFSSRRRRRTHVDIARFIEQMQVQQAGQHYYVEPAEAVSSSSHSRADYDYRYGYTMHSRVFIAVLISDFCQMQPTYAHMTPKMFMSSTSQLLPSGRLVASRPMMMQYSQVVQARCHSYAPSLHPLQWPSGLRR